jgi:hypothetical protein
LFHLDPAVIFSVPASKKCAFLSENLPCDQTAIFEEATAHLCLVVARFVELNDTVWGGRGEKAWAYEFEEWIG